MVMSIGAEDFPAGGVSKLGIGEWKRNVQKLIDGSHSKWVMFEPTDFRRSLIAAQNSGSDVGVITSLRSVGGD